MSVIHEIHFAGCDKSVELDLETDDLYRTFVAWLKGDNIRGMVVKTEEHTIAIASRRWAASRLVRSQRSGWASQAER